MRGPDDNDPDRLLQFLYPSEVSTFLACEDVPLAWRVNAAIAVYLCLRDGEQRALKWSAVDLEHGVVTICETYDRRAGEDREGTKSGAARVVPIRPELVQLLTAMHDATGGKGYVCPLPSERAMARGLRTWLRHAGVDRPALFVTTSVSKQIRWHDLRATGLTWLAVEGGNPNQFFPRGATSLRGLTLGQRAPSTQSMRSGVHAGSFDDLPGATGFVPEQTVNDTGSFQPGGGLLGPSCGNLPAITFSSAAQLTHGSAPILGFVTPVVAGVQFFLNIGLPPPPIQ